MLTLLVGIAALGGLLFGYETGVAAGALVAAQREWGHPAHYLVILSTGTLIGALVGSLAAGALCERVGRRDVIMATAALFTLGAFTSAIAPGFFVLLLGRAVVGVAVGAISVAAPLYIAEIAPARRRGAAIGAFQLAVTLGLLAAFVGSEFLAGRPDGWRYLLAAGAAPGVALSGLALLLVESPFWLVQQGDRESAERAAAVLRIPLTGSDLSFSGPGAPERSGRLADLFSPIGRSAIFLACSLFAIQQFVGINAILYYAPANLITIDPGLGGGLTDARTLPIVLVNVAMTLVAMGLVDRVGRRRLLLASLAAVALGLAMMAGGFLAASWEAPLGRLASTAGLFVFIAGFALGLGPIPWMFAAEVMPIQARGAAMGIVVSSHWLFDSIASPTSLLLTNEFGKSLIFLVYAGVAVAGLAIVRRAFPETRGLTLAAVHQALKARCDSAANSRFVHYLVTTLATTGGMLTGFNFAITASTLVLITSAWELDALSQGVAASALLVGLAAGSFLAGSLSDRFGRRYVLMSTAALFVASAFGSALAPSLPWLVAARMAAGAAIGITSPTAGLYVAEIAPTAIRGRLLSFEAVTYGLGALLAYGVSLAFENLEDGWRYMFAFIAVPSTIYGLALLPLPESPRWLAAAGRYGAARRVLVQLSPSEADRVLAEIRLEADGMGGASGAEPGKPDLWSRPYRPAVLLGLVLMFLIVFSGWDMVLFYAPTVLKEAGFEDTTVAFAATMGLGAVFLLLTLVSLAIVDSVGRRPMVISGLLVMAACLFVMAVLTFLHAPTSGIVRWALVGTLAVFVGTFALTLGQVAEIVISEIYPQAIRGPASSLSHGMRSLFAIAFTLTFPFLMAVMGLGLTFLSYGVISLVGALYLWRELPETKDKSLEEISRYWRDRAASNSTALVEPDCKAQSS